MAAQKVLVKRLVCIEDLGDIDVLFTDKTGTLTQGRISFMRAIAATGADTDRRPRAGACCAPRPPSTTGTPSAAIRSTSRCGTPPARSRRPTSPSTAAVAIAAVRPRPPLVSVLVATATATGSSITKGAPEAVLAAASTYRRRRAPVLDGRVRRRQPRRRGRQPRRARAHRRSTPTDEHDLHLAGLLVFLDPPKPSAAAALARLAELGITVKIVTGDNPVGGRRRSATTSGCPPAARSPAPTSTPSTTPSSPRGDRRPRPSSPGSAPSRRPASSASSASPARRGVPRRRRQRRPRPARRRRRDLGRLGHRRRQGRRRRHPAGEGPRRARRRRRRGPADLRQHHQVRADGHVQQLRQHVQRRRRLRVPALPADAAVPDPAQQPALRHQPDWPSPPTTSTRNSSPPVALGHRLHPPLHALLRTVQLGVRLRHLRRHAVGVPPPRR